MMDVVKQEILKLLEVGVIYLISISDERDMIEIVTAAQKHSEFEVEYFLHAFHQFFPSFTQLL